jgi:restriction system protein
MPAWGPTAAACSTHVGALSRIKPGGAVGNDVVQRGAAGKVHYNADYAVVTNDTYTSSAKRVAPTNRVLPLHYSDLRNLDSLFGIGG